MVCVAKEVCGFPPPSLDSLEPYSPSTLYIALGDCVNKLFILNISRVLRLSSLVHCDIDESVKLTFVRLSDTKVSYGEYSKIFCQ